LVELDIAFNGLCSIENLPLSRMARLVELDVCECIAFIHSILVFFTKPLRCYYRFRALKASHRRLPLPARKTSLNFEFTDVVASIRSPTFINSHHCSTWWYVVIDALHQPLFCQQPNVCR
jgi:hypothetical protein